MVETHIQQHKKNELVLFTPKDDCSLYEVTTFSFCLRSVSLLDNNVVSVPPNLRKRAKKNYLTPFAPKATKKT
jgi:hypothetical protein